MLLVQLEANQPIGFRSRSAVEKVIQMRFPQISNRKARFL